MVEGIRTGCQQKSQLDPDWASSRPLTKISWNFLASRLNYSCQPEFDAASETMTDPQTLGDEELLRLTRAGDEHAFTVLYRRHQGPIYRFALQMSGSESVADDVTQEVFLALMRDFSQFDSARGSLASYLYGVARNQVRRHLERGQFQVPLDEESDEDSFALVTAPGDPLGDLTLREGLSALRQAILTLPLHYREVVFLCDLEEMSYDDAARTIGCPMGTIRSRLHRAHALLIQKLREANETSSGVGRNSMRCFT
jgi:RNA polymerase sigma-70 factor, ECF subfamily